MKKLHLWVWGTAAVAGVVAAALNEYRPNHHLCNRHLTMNVRRVCTTTSA